MWPVAYRAGRAGSGAGPLREIAELTRYFLTSALIHGALIVGAATLVQWGLRTPPPPPVIRVLPSEAIAVEEEPRTQAPFEDATPVESPPVRTRPEVPPIEPPIDDAPDAVAVEPPPFPDRGQELGPELLLRVRPVVVHPPPRSVPEPPTEQQLEPRLPQDYVENLQRDPCNEPPRYPMLARKRNVSGEVVVGVLVGVDGSARRLRIVTPAGSSAAHRALHAAALKALQAWRYPPILSNGRAVEFEVHIPVSFQLR